MHGVQVAVDGERVETGDVVQASKCMYICTEQSVYLLPIRAKTSGVAQAGDRVWVKVIDIAWGKCKYFVSRKYVNQETGADLDPAQEELDQEKAKAAEQRALKAAQVLEPSTPNPGALARHFLIRFLSS
jgi:hypothetical protein